MAEYIEREAAIAKCREIVACEWNHRASPVSWADAYEQFAEDIEEIQTADVAPVRHGRWITTSGEVFPGSGQFLCYSHKHDECGFQYVDMSENEYDFCPHCGAKMLDLEG